MRTKEPGLASNLLSKGERTREKLLDAAEQEFAARGFNGVSMRQIADEASLGLGVVTYHFPNKEGLFETVVERRAEELATLRKAQLDALDDVTLHGILRAFFEPFLQKIESGGTGWSNYAQILAHVAQDARWSALAKRLFADAARTFIKLIRTAEPGLSLAAATRAYVHLIAVMVGFFAQTQLLDQLSNGRLKSDDLRGNLDDMISFAAGGIKALGR